LLNLVFMPYNLLFLSVAIYIQLMVGYFVQVDFFFRSTAIHAARIASVNPDQSAVEDSIYNAISQALPTTASGITLFSPSDIDIDQNDGDNVTTTITYRVMLPGVDFFTQFGISPDEMVIPLTAKYSYYRDY
jgi:hypothetical protein